MKKKKSRPKKPQKEIKTTASVANLFLNIIIIVLTALIVFMSYSLYNKISEKNKVISKPVDDKAAEIVQIEVLNGCGVSGVADKFTDYLRNNNFDVVNVDNYRVNNSDDPSFDMDRTLVVDRTGNKANAIKVAEAIGVDKNNIIQQINNNYFLDVSLIIGRDYKQLKPEKN